MIRFTGSAKRLPSRRAIVMTAWLMLACSSAALAAEASDSGPITTKKSSIDFSVAGGYEYQFLTDLDEGGDVSIQRFNFFLSAESELTEDQKLSFSLGYNLDMYEFGGDTTFQQAQTSILLTDPDNLNPDGTLLTSISVPVEPWDDIHTCALSLMITTQLSNEWSIFAGPVFQMSWEDGAEWSKSITAGGAVGTSVQIYDWLTIGAGLVGVTQLENGYRLFPMFILDWQITSDLRLTNRTRNMVGKTAGLELVWAPMPKWELAVGGAYEFRRFRLDDNDLGPDGVGEETRIPIWGRIGYQFNDNFSVDVFGGISRSDQLLIVDEDGHKLADDEVGGAAIAGLRVSLRF